MAKIKIRPLDDRVVVEPMEAEEVTAGGIVLPDAAQEKPQRGTVVAVGPANCSTVANVVSCPFQLATKSFSASTAELKSKSKAAMSKFFVKATSSPKLSSNRFSLQANQTINQGIYRG